MDTAGPTVSQERSVYGFRWESFISIVFGHYTVPTVCVVLAVAVGEQTVAPVPSKNNDLCPPADRCAQKSHIPESTVRHRGIKPQPARNSSHVESFACLCSFRVL